MIFRKKINMWKPWIRILCGSGSTGQKYADPDPQQWCKYMVVHYLLIFLCLKVTCFCLFNSRCHFSLLIRKSTKIMAMARTMADGVQSKQMCCDALGKTNPGYQYD